MFTALAIIHILVCVFLILVVLLQTGKGSDIGAVFGGGGSQALFGGSGPGTFLGKLTAGVAVLFMLTALLMAGRFFAPAPQSVMHESSAPPAAGTPATTPQEAPAAQAPASEAPAVPEKAPEKQ
jgi:preprotein translocase subunit SecG